MASGIYVVDIRNHHPVGIESPTDAYYTRVGNILFKLLLPLNFGRNNQQELKKDIALSLAMYLEDTVSDIGLWASFTAEHKRRYGKSLPFYDVDEEDYFPDEQHLDDRTYRRHNY